MTSLVLEERELRHECGLHGGVVMNKFPRVAFFTDSYHETNGVALTSREFVAFAKRRGRPIFDVHPGPETRLWRDGESATFEVGNSDAALPLEHDLKFDLRFYRHKAKLRDALRAFRPDLVHVTGPGHCGILGASLAHELRLPLAASWHTNLHQFAARRLERLLGRLPAPFIGGASELASLITLRLVLRFYKLARVVFAPNEELISLLARRTGLPCFPMERGVDARLFSPDRRTRSAADPFVIGYVGRLSPEKSVRDLATLERAMIEAGIERYRFLIVGEGVERTWLRENLRKADLPGAQRGETLAESYANMDVFAFPSQTDTFGNVVVEAQASGIPVVAMASGGPKFLVRHGVDGFVAGDMRAFADCVLTLFREPERRRRMREAGRAAALTRSWDAVIESVYALYGQLAA